MTDVVGNTAVIPLATLDGYEAVRVTRWEHDPRMARVELPGGVVRRGFVVLPPSAIADAFEMLLS